MQPSPNQLNNFFSDEKNRDVLQHIARYLSLKEVMKLIQVNKLLNRTIKESIAPFYLLHDQEKNTLTYNEVLTNFKRQLNLKQALKKLEMPNELENHFLSFDLEKDSPSSYLMFSFLFVTSTTIAAMFSAQSIDVYHYHCQSITQLILGPILFFLTLFYFIKPSSLSLSDINNLLEAGKPVALASALHSGGATILTTYFELNNPLALIIQTIPTLYIVFIYIAFILSNNNQFVKNMINNHISDTLYGLSCALMCAFTFSIFNMILGGITEDFTLPNAPKQMSLFEAILIHGAIIPFMGGYVGASAGVAVATTIGNSYRATHVLGQQFFKYYKKQKMKQKCDLENQVEKLCLIKIN